MSCIGFGSAFESGSYFIAQFRGSVMFAHVGKIFGGGIYFLQLNQLHNIAQILIVPPRRPIFDCVELERDKMESRRNLVHATSHLPIDSLCMNLVERGV